MSTMQGRRVFIGAGLSVVAWGGNKGDIYFAQTPRAIKRSEYASSSIIVAGSFAMVEVPFDDDVHKWPIIKAGQMCNLLLPDFKKGNYNWVAQEDNSVEYCVGTANPGGGPDYCMFTSKPVVSGPFKIPQGSILIIAVGEVSVNKDVFGPGSVLHAKNQDVNVTMNVGAKGMWAVRT